MDGAAGQLFRTLDRHPFRPAHIHLMVSAEGFKPLITQLYPRDDQWVQNDTVFAVKDDLLLDFEPSKDDSRRSGSRCAGRLESSPRCSCRSPRCISSVAHSSTSWTPSHLLSVLR